MAKSKGIGQHPIFKLGKAPAKRDPRNLKFAAILKAPAKLPTEYDFDLKHPGIPTPMFGNDHYGDCVIAGRAHQTLRFELLEQVVMRDDTDWCGRSAHGRLDSITLCTSSLASPICSSTSAISIVGRPGVRAL